MPPFRDVQDAVLQGKTRLSAAEQALQSSRNQLSALEAALRQAARSGGESGVEAAELRSRVARARADVTARATAVANAKAGLLELAGRWPALGNPRELVEQLDDRLPFLLLPVRVETRFMRVNGNAQLWVRIFPDDIAVHSHEAALTADEVQTGIAYWREAWQANRESDEQVRRDRLEGAWRAVAGETGGTRAAWVARQTKPTNLDAAAPEDLVFPPFDPEELKPESWSEPPRVKVMPDRFVVMTFAGGVKVHEMLGAPIPDPLVIGPDPQKLEADLARDGGELRAGPDIAWIYDFGEAERIGMGIRIPLAEPHASQGFDRVLVLGLKLSADAGETARLVEELIENHHYAPDGMSFVPQGVPTNNTDAGRSGFSSVDVRGEAGFATELGEPLFEPVDDGSGSDAQCLAEALGIDHRPLQHLRFADRRDVREAQAMNRALWPATLGYYLEEMLGLGLGTVRDVRRFFVEYVTGRGSLPALRIATQPYGVLVTSAFSRWEWSPEEEDSAFLGRLTDLLRRLDARWSGLVAQVAHVGAPGDPFENLLRTLGLHATSVQYHRRHGVGPDFQWNYPLFLGREEAGRRMQAYGAEQASQLFGELGVTLETHPKILDLAFFDSQDLISDPLVADVAQAADERWSETDSLTARYKIPEIEDLQNYIGWLLRGAIDDIKQQRFRGADGETLPAPRPLLYRVLQGALLLAYYDATMNLYVERDIVDAVARREIELSNVRAERTVTRWEFMEARAAAVLPGLTSRDLSVVGHLQTLEGLALDAASQLRELRASLEELGSLPTARLERLFAEHVDLCTYRLDAWQTALFARRLETLRFPTGSRRFGTRVAGLYLGAFGWLENLRPAPTPVPVNPADIPESLREPHKGPITEQPDNGGFIHGFSLNHAVAAAVLRNAYLTHADPAKPRVCSVNLSSDRVRRALATLEGIRAGQELGALLGYQFERGLHDRHPGLALDQYVSAFRQRYPLVADKITADAQGAEITLKEPRNVVDGYALVEAVFLSAPPAPYPYNVENLPGAASQAGLAIQAEVTRLAESLDAVADLALSEGVYQVVQGNYDRAGAMLKALADGSSPPPAEIALTPRSGSAISHKVAVHLETGGALAQPWPGALTPGAKTEPGLNQWLGRVIGPPQRIRYTVSFTNPVGTDLAGTLADLDVQPIDLIYLLGDEVDARGAERGSRDNTTEIESRIAYAFRRRKRGTEGVSDVGDVRIQFMQRDASWVADDKTMFEMLPLLRALRDLVTRSRPLGAHDYQLPSEVVTDPASDPNPTEWDEAESKGRVEARIAELGQVIAALETAIGAATGDSTVATLESLRAALVALAAWGLPDAFPQDAVGTSVEVRERLLTQGRAARDLAERKRARAEEIKNLDHLGDEERARLTVEDRVQTYRAAAREILDPGFNLLPRFVFKNPGELSGAAGFRDASDGLTRFSANPLIVDEWLQGAARVRGKLDLLETTSTLASAFGHAELDLKPLQLPYRAGDHWVAVRYPEVAPEERDDPAVFKPEGEFVSLVHLPPPSGFAPAAVQTGFVVDEWSEIIPANVETTGIAIHYDQPGSEPPQTLLLAVSPRLTGTWTWDDLVAILEDTLERAKKRAVEPDLLGSTPFAHLLPGIVTAVTRYLYATVSTDLVYQTAMLATAAPGTEGDPT